MGLNAIEMDLAEFEELQSIRDEALLQDDAVDEYDLKAINWDQQAEVFLAESRYVMTVEILKGIVERQLNCTFVAEYAMLQNYGNHKVTR